MSEKNPCFYKTDDDEIVAQHTQVDEENGVCFPANQDPRYNRFFASNIFYGQITLLCFIASCVILLYVLEEINLRHVYYCSCTIY